jgi:hypothetical protein
VPKEFADVVQGGSRFQQAGAKLAPQVMEMEIDGAVGGLGFVRQPVPLLPMWLVYDPTRYGVQADIFSSVRRGGAARQVRRRGVEIETITPPRIAAPAIQRRRVTVSPSNATAPAAVTTGTLS